MNEQKNSKKTEEWNAESDRVWKEPRKYIDYKYSCVPAQDIGHFNYLFNAVIDKSTKFYEITYYIKYSSPTIRSIIEDTLPNESQKAILGLKPVIDDKKLEEKVLRWADMSAVCDYDRELDKIEPFTIFRVKATPYSHHAHEFVKFMQGLGYEITEERFLIGTRYQSSNFDFEDDEIEEDAYLKSEHQDIEMRIGGAFSFYSTEDAMKWHEWAWNLTQNVILPEFVKNGANQRPWGTRY